MSTPVEIQVNLPQPLLEQAQALARQLGLTPDRLFELALKSYLQNDPGRAPQPESSRPGPVRADERLIHQGDLYWVALPGPDGSEPGLTHPQVIVQEDVLNHSRIPTVVVCGLTSNLKRASLPGNVLLEAGEANLPRPSVVVVSQVSVVEKTQLGETIGSLAPARVKQILDGMRFLQESTRR